MNRLVGALLAHREVIDLALDRDEASFEFLADQLGDALLSRAERAAIGADARLATRLTAGYLPVITASEWDGAVSEAADDVSVGAGWWTVMIPAGSGTVGLTIPQDASDTDLVALFDRRGTGARVFAYDPAAGSVTYPSGTGHCGPPTRRGCSGRCGQCKPLKFWDKKTGIVIKCRCPHLSS